VLFSVLAGLIVLTSGSWAVDATLVGNRSSRRPCQRMFGGLLTMLNMANLRIWLTLREKGVCADARQQAGSSKASNRIAHAILVC
jgi:hypothetical protein